MRTLEQMTTPELQALRAAISAERCDYCDRGIPDAPCVCWDDMDQAAGIDAELRHRGVGPKVEE
jgi:hypothetical protein